MDEIVGKGCGCLVLVGLAVFLGFASSGMVPWLTDIYAYIVGGGLALIVFVLLLIAVGGGREE